MPLSVADIEDAYPLADAADVLHMNTETLRRMIKAGRIQAVRLGFGKGRLFVPRRAVAEYLNRSRVLVDIPKRVKETPPPRQDSREARPDTDTCDASPADPDNTTGDAA